MSNAFIKEIIDMIQQTWYIWVLILCIALLKLFTPIIKGALGEQAVHVVLRSLNPKKYFIIHNVIIATDEKLTQIDHIVVARTGIYVIETKNYKGLITGSETTATWTQHLNKRRIFFHNPIRQNHAHTMALSTVLHLPASRFISLIAFSPDAKMKVETKTKVVRYSMLADSIRRNTLEVLTSEEMDRITKEITEIKQRNKKLRKEQIKQVQKQIE